MKNDDMEEMIYEQEIYGCVFKAQHRYYLKQHANLHPEQCLCLARSESLLEAHVLIIAQSVMLDGPCAATGG